MPAHLRELLFARNGVRDENRRALLRAVMINPDSQVNLGKRARLSGGTVSESVRALEEQGLVRSEKAGRGAIVRMAETVGAGVGIQLGRHGAAVGARRGDQDYQDAGPSYGGGGRSGPWSGSSWAATGRRSWPAGWTRTTRTRRRGCSRSPSAAG